MAVAKCYGHECVQQVALLILLMLEPPAVFPSRLAEEMSIPSLPEMLFGDNVLRIQHTDGFGIEFNAIDALKRVNNMEDAIKVACAQEWQDSRQDDRHCVFSTAGGRSYCLDTYCVIAYQDGMQQ